MPGNSAAIRMRLQIHLPSVANQRLHWAVKARLSKSQRTLARISLCASSPIPPSLPVTVVLTRISPRKLDDDNLRSAFKAVRDGVADWLGHDDGNTLIDWQYRQVSEGAKKRAVEIEVIA